MNAELLAMYRKCRVHKPFMLVGSDAKCSLDAARTILKFRELESRGLVRMRAEPERENYFDVFGRPEGYRAASGRWVCQSEAEGDLERLIERDGVWWTCSEWFDGDEWQQADSCGMHAGYKDPLSPFENCYVVDEMQAAIDAWEAHVAEMAGAI